MPVQAMLEQQIRNRSASPLLSDASLGGGYNDPEGATPKSNAKALMEQLRQPPLLALPTPAALAPFIGSQIEVRSRFTVFFAATSLFYLFYLDIFGVLVSLVAFVALTLEGGFKAFADNVRILQSNNEQYLMLVDQQREQNLRLERDISELQSNVQGLSQQNPALHTNVNELQQTKDQLNSSVDQLRKHEHELDTRNRALKGSIEQLEASRTQLQQSGKPVQDSDLTSRLSLSLSLSLPFLYLSLRPLPIH